MTTADEDCTLTGYSIFDGCTCLNSSLTCFGEGGVKNLPPQSKIPRDVTVLTITGYVITRLDTSSMLGTLDELVNLDLSNNKIEIITEDSFSGKNFPKLKILSLEENNVNETTYVTDDTHIFKDLSSLQELNLRKAFTSNFTRSETFKDVFNSLDYRHLTKLILSGNDIEILNTEFFHHANKLEEIYLSGCNLIMVNNSTFTMTTLPQLKLLDLSNNNLMVFRDDVVEDFKTFDSNQTEVNLTGNPLECICTSMEFIKWLKNTSLVIEKEFLTCHDSDFTGRHMVDIDVSKFTCDDDDDADDKNVFEPTFHAQYVILFIIFGILGLLALIILFMRRNDILQFCMQVRQATKDAFDSHQTHYTYSGIQNAKRVTPEEAGVASV